MFLITPLCSTAIYNAWKYNKGHLLHWNLWWLMGMRVHHKQQHLSNFHLEMLDNDIYHYPSGWCHLSYSIILESMKLSNIHTGIIAGRLHQIWPMTAQQGHIGAVKMKRRHRRSLARECASKSAINWQHLFIWQIEQYKQNKECYFITHSFGMHLSLFLSLSFSVCVQMCDISSYEFPINKDVDQKSQWVMTNCH